MAAAKSSSYAAMAATTTAPHMLDVCSMGLECHVAAGAGGRGC